MEALKPCPFCGGPAEHVDIDEGENAGGSCICCTSCLASGNVEFEFKENFVSNWNRRVLDPRIAEIEARAEEAEAMSAALHMEVNRLQTKAMGAVDAAQTAEAELARLRVVGTFNEGIEAAADSIDQKAREIRNLSTITAFAIAAILQEMVDRIRSLRRS